ncbi:hypothetical protein LCGC14_1883770 [marine sediment metagenome]|uniref:Uncharacterized protein n=1 Tax=marine sediment metagenome TaxID=412755 RepID=A0A0F9GPU3_9ZZZZ
MSIEKWLSKKDSKEEAIKREKIFKKLSKEEVQELKKKKARDLVQKKSSLKVGILEEDDLLQKVIEFNDWLNHRTYLKGDLDKIEMWLKNLYSKIKSEPAQESNFTKGSQKSQAIEQYKKIPPRFLDEKTRIAISKNIHGVKKSNKDNYNLRKLRNLIQEKLIEAKYYEILEKILKL